MHRILAKFEYPGFCRCHSVCGLQLMPLPDGRVVVVVTELPENPGTSVTNCAESLARLVCRRFEIDPACLVWVEHYGYPSAVRPREPRPYSLVTFKVLRHGPAWEFVLPHWRLMTADDWIEMGLRPRE